MARDKLSDEELKRRKRERDRKRYAAKKNEIKAKRRGRWAEKKDEIKVKRRRNLEKMSPAELREYRKKEAWRSWLWRAEQSEAKIGDRNRKRREAYKQGQRSNRHATVTSLEDMPSPETVKKYHKDILDCPEKEYFLRVGADCRWLEQRHKDAVSSLRYAKRDLDREIKKYLEDEFLVATKDDAQYLEARHQAVLNDARNEKWKILERLSEFPADYRVSGKKYQSCEKSRKHHCWYCNEFSLEDLTKRILEKEDAVTKMQEKVDKAKEAYKMAYVVFKMREAKEQYNKLLEQKSAEEKEKSNEMITAIFGQPKAIEEGERPSEPYQFQLSDKIDWRGSRI
ncbi:hypothetical protein ACHAWF_009976 [Thalassiosira exigua]